MGPGKGCWPKSWKFGCIFGGTIKKDNKSCFNIQKFHNIYSIEV